MDTCKIKHDGVGMIAHRGVSGLECENTAAAFVAAGNRSYFGIETDVHRTADGQFVIFHDDDTGRISGQNLHVESSTLEQLRSIRLNDINGAPSRGDLIPATPQEYISICKKYEKTAVLELKNAMAPEDIYRVMDIIREQDYLDGTIIIAFDFNNLIALRSRYPHQNAQHLMLMAGETPEAIAQTTDRLKKYNLGMDIFHGYYTPQVADAVHKNGITINVWTVDTPEHAARVLDLGVDYITTNILE